MAGDGRVGKINLSLFSSCLRLVYSTLRGFRGKRAGVVTGPVRSRLGISSFVTWRARARVTGGREEDVAGQGVVVFPLVSRSSGATKLRRWDVAKSKPNESLRC